MAGNAWYYDYMNPDFLLKKALVNQDLSYLNYRYIKDIVNTRVSMFSYANIDKIGEGKLTSQILELALMFFNHLCFYNSEELGGYVLCRYVFGSNFNIYYKPRKVNILALNGSPIAYSVPYEDIIEVRDNRMDILPFMCISEYLEKINRIEDGMFKVLNICTLPMVMVGDKKLANQLKQTAKKLGVNDPYIFGDDTLVDSVKGFDVKVPISPLDIYDLKTKYKNECMASLGIYSVEQKRERIVTQELVNQNDYTDFVYQGAKMERDEFIKQINEKTGLSVKLIETYDINYNEGIKEKADTIAATTKAQAKSIKDIEPEALINANSVLSVKKNG